MNLSYVCASRRGTFQIIQHQARWHLCLDGDCFDGPFQTADIALQELIGGHCAWPSCGDPSQMGLPDDLSDWVLTRV